MIRKTTSVTLVSFALFGVLTVPWSVAAPPRLVNGGNGQITVEVDVTDRVADHGAVRGQERARAMPVQESSQSAAPRQQQPAAQHQHQSSTQRDSEGPSFFDKFKTSMSSFGRRVFGDDEDATSTPRSNASAATTPTNAPNGAQRNFGGQGTSTTVATTPPRTVPPKPATGAAARDDVSTPIFGAGRPQEFEQPALVSSSDTRNASSLLSNDTDAINAYARLRELRSRAQGFAGSEPLVAQPQPRVAGRIDVDAIERQTQQSYRDPQTSPQTASTFRPRGMTAFDDTTGAPSVYPTTVAHLPPLTSTETPRDPWNTAVETMRDVRQQPAPQELPRTMNDVPRDPWGNPLPTEATPRDNRFGAPTSSDRGATYPRTATPSNSMRTPDTRSALSGQQPLAGMTSAGGTPIQVYATEDRSMVSTSPIIDVQTQGPQSIVVGQESAYRIRVANRSNAVAEQVTFQVELPPWVEIQPPDVSAGTTDVVNATTGDAGTKIFRWKLDRLDPQGEDQLVLYLVPRERKAFSLQLHYDFKRPTAVTEIDVREPRLEMALDGPSKVLWGSEEVYRLRIRNVGNGDAEAIHLTLLSSSDTEGNSAEPFVLDQLKAGDEKTLEVKAWARQDESLEINVIATGAYNLEAKTSRRVLVMRPRMEVVVDAPSLQFVGNTGEATILVRNIGDAPADNVEVVATLPLGAKFISSTLDGTSTPQNDVLWGLDSIPVGGEFTAKITYELRRPGVCRLDVAVREQTGLHVKGAATTQVESIADLSMKLQNPQGPVEIGSEAVYSITLLNRGTCAAEGVEVIVAFVDQLDPIAVEGMSGEIDASRGMIVFDKIPSLGPGQSLVLKARARAKAAGTHKMRAEVICESTNTHIAHEESNLFYVKQRAADRPAGNATQAPSTTSSPTTAPAALPAAPATLPSAAPLSPLPSASDAEQVPSPFGPTSTLPPLTQLPRENLRAR